ncbi:MAG: metallophosphoesterase [Patescibacteria group bacterium]|nr:metallophosphoesterase [Patescibacteria group bacterium]
MPVICSDAHLDVITSGIERFEDVKRALNKTIAAAKEDGGPWVFLGDWSDPMNHRTTRCEAYAIEVAAVLRSNGIPSVWLTGNHDVVEDGHSSHTLLPLKNYAIETLDNDNYCVVLDYPTIFFPMNEEYQIVALPYTSRAGAYDPEAFIEKAAKIVRPDLKTYIIGHLDVEGITPGSETTDMPRGRQVFWPLKAIAKHFPEAKLFGGHIHKRQLWRSDGVELQIVGSLERLSFSEEHDNPGFLVV